jgi:serine phosphatase RsbU (regulator of sigma subunit)
MRSPDATRLTQAPASLPDRGPAESSLAAPFQVSPSVLTRAISRAAVWLLHLPSWPAAVAGLLCGSLLALIVLVDHLSGPDVQVSLLYFLPIIVASLRFEIRGGLLVAVASAVLTYLADEVGAGKAVPAAVVALNTLGEAIIFLLVALVTGMLQRQGGRLSAQREELAAAAGRMRDDLRAAELLQQHLICRPLPSVNGWEVAADVRYARGVGGDFYDLRRAGQRIALCVADVSGKGPRAALISAALRGMLDEDAGRPADPVRFLRHLNARMYRALPDDMFVTMFYGLLDPETGVLTYASAGHDPPLVLGPASPRELAPTAPALGVTPELTGDATRVTLEPGEALLLYTDGLTTAHHPVDGRWSLERLIDDLQTASTLPAPEFIAALFHRIGADGPVPPEDDVTLIAVRRC